MWTHSKKGDFTIDYIDLRISEKEILSAKIINDLHRKYENVEKITFVICYIWELRPGKLMLITNSNKLSFKDQCRDSNGIINDNYIVDLPEKEGEEGHIR